MPFKKGQSGNPNGRLRSDWRTQFDKAIETVSKRMRKSLFEHAIEQAYKDKTVLVAVLRKCLPDLQSVRTELTGGTPFSLIISVTPQVIPGNVTGDIKELQAATPVIPITSIVSDVLTSKAVKTQPKVKTIKGKAHPKSKRKPTTRTRTAKRCKVKNK